MSGHSKWATTHRQKSAADAKKGAAFTKISNLITIAVKQAGGDPDANFSLRLAMDKARAANMPKDNIERAIKRGLGVTDGQAALEEVLYEAFGPAGSAFLIETITDNKNRTISDLKAVINKNGGQLAGPNSVAWMFERRGIISIEIPKQDLDELELTLIDAGAIDIDKQDELWDVYTEPTELQKVLLKLKENNISIKESGLTYIPKDELIVGEADDQQKLEKFYGVINDLDDVNNVYTNANW